MTKPQHSEPAPAPQARPAPPSTCPQCGSDRPDLHGFVSANDITTPGDWKMQPSGFIKLCAHSWHVAGEAQGEAAAPEMCPNLARFGTIHAASHEQTLACHAPPRCKRVDAESNPRTWVDKTPAYVEGEGQPWEPGPNITGKPVHEWGTPNSEARVSVGAQPGCPECGGIPCANLDVCKAPAPDLEQQLTDAAFSVGSNAGNAQLVVDLGEAIDIAARSRTGS